jgi:succinyl-CoA synthetase beta subunit
MNIHEYQAKSLLREFGAPVSEGTPVLHGEDAHYAAESLPGPIWVVKAQIHAGGRGKGRFKESEAGCGRRRAHRALDGRRRDDGAADARQDAGHRADRPEGKQVNRVYIENGSEILKEFYLSMLVDRAHSRWRSSSRPRAA